jgi:hypothetical protein
MLAIQLYPVRKSSSRPLPSWVLDLDIELTLDTVQAIREPSEAAREICDKTGNAVLTAGPHVIQIECSVVGVVRDVGPEWKVAKLNALVNAMNSFSDASSSSLNGLYDNSTDDLKKWYVDTKEITRSLLKSRSQLDEASADQLFWETWSFHLTDQPEGYPSKTVDPRSSLARQLFEFHTFEVEKLPVEVTASEDFRPNEQFRVRALEFLRSMFSCSKSF